MYKNIIPSFIYAFYMCIIYVSPWLSHDLSSFVTVLFLSVNVKA